MTALNSVSLIGAGCCANVYTLEKIVSAYPDSGHLVTFSQFIAVAIEGAITNYDPRTKSFTKRNVPVKKWFMIALLFFSTSILNNWAFSFKIQMSLHILFRSSSICTSMLLSWLIFKQSFPVMQIAGAFLVTSGIVLSTLASVPASTTSTATGGNWYIGVIMLTFTVLLSSFLGILQQKTYETHGKHWKEGLFYTHLLSIPLFIPLSPQIISTALVYSKERWAYLLLNGLTQYICVRGVVGLSSQVSNVTLNLVLSLRKFVSLAISVIVFGGSFGLMNASGAVLVLFGTLVYSVGCQTPSAKPVKVVLNNKEE